MNKKKLLLFLSIVGLLFLMSGCSMPTDAEGKIIQITDSTTFKYMMDNEGFFSAILVCPLAKCINFLVPKTSVAAAILIVSLTINAILLLFTWKQNVSQQKMQMLQSDIDRIQKKYEGRTDKNSQMRQASEIQSLYANAGINPLGSLLVTFVQFPLLIAMYYAVQRSSYVATGTFLGMQLSITPLQAVATGSYGQFVIFLMMIGAQIVAMRVPMWLSERRAKMEAEKHYKRYVKPEENATMQTTMFIMPIFIGFIMLNWPTAMSFYYLISSLIMIGKSVLVDSFVAKKEK